MERYLAIQHRGSFYKTQGFYFKYQTTPTSRNDDFVYLFVFLWVLSPFLRFTVTSIQVILSTLINTINYL